MAIDTTKHLVSQTEVDLIQPANEAAFEAQAVPVQILVLDGGARRFVRDNEPIKKDELWHGEARNPYIPESSAIPVYLRIAEPNPMVAELLCSVIARSLGLPAPEAYVVIIEPGQLEESTLASKTERLAVVGTKDIGGATFAQLLREDSATAQAMIRQWEHLVPVTVLDEWLANPDRNLNNILYVARTLHIIDHAEAFGGSHRTLFPLADITNDIFANKLAAHLDSKNPAKCNDILAQAREWIAFAAGGVDVQKAVAAAGVARWQSAEEEAELVHFINTRLTITHNLLCSRLGHPQLSL